MRYKAILPLLILSFICSAQDTIRGKVVKVADGDTFTMMVEGEKVKIRSYGIDAPEMNQAHGKAAQKFLSNKILSKNVSVLVKGKDRYSRVLGIAFLDGIDINLETIKAGYAWHYSYYDNTPSYIQAEKDAKSKRLGLWRDKNPINPYRWRKGDR